MHSAHTQLTITGNDLEQVLRTLIILLLSLLNISGCYAELIDPTKPAYYSTNKETVYTQTDTLKVSSIWISSNAKRATINGVTAKQGETIFTDLKIIKILPSSVLVEQNGIRRKLYLLTRPFKTR